MTFTSSVGASGLGADCSRQGRGVRKYCETESQVIEMIHLTGLYHSLITFLVFMLISSNCGVLFPNIRKTNTFSHFDVKLLLKHRMYSHIKQHILHTLHTDPHFYTETRPHTHIPVVGPAPNALTSSLYPPRFSSSSSLYQSQVIAGGEHLHERHCRRERVRKGLK